MSKHWSRLPWLWARAANAVRFVIIVWSLAGALLVLQSVAERLMERAVLSGAVTFSPEATQGSAPAQAQNPRSPKETSADEQDKRSAIPTTRAPLDPAVVKNARMFIWQLGFDMGKLGFMSQTSAAQDPAFAQLWDEPRKLSAALGLAVPDLPTIQHRATGAGEFAKHLEADARGTVADLTQQFSAEHGRLYQFAAVAGYEFLFYRLTGSSGPVLGPQLKRYAELAKVPPELWTPLLRGPGGNRSGAEVQVWVDGVVGKLQAFHRGRP